jgi:hypothetical protein
MALQPLWTLAAFQFHNPRQSIGLLGREISPSQGRYLHRTTQTQNKRRQTSMPRVGFEPKIPVFASAKTVHALHREATVMASDLCYATKLSKFDDAAVGSVHSCTLSRDISRTVRGNRTQFMVTGFVLIRSTNFYTSKNPSPNLKK